MPSRHHDPSFRACGYALLLVLGVVWGSTWAQSSTPTAGQPSTPTASPSSEPVSLVMAQLEKLTTAFNAGNVSGVSGLFHPDGELIDEAGTIYQGRAEIETLAQAFFAKYPGVQMVAQVDSLRPLGPVVVMEGTRGVTTQDGKEVALIRFSAVWSRGEGGYQLVSLRDFADQLSLGPKDALQPLAWLIGDWVNEGSDAHVKISYRWSPDGNFILGDIEVHLAADKAKISSSQRIGWDARLGKIRSWIFDADGGFGESVWTSLGDSWLIRSTAVTPDGQSGMARVELIPIAADRYLLRGSDRMIGDVPEEDYELTVVKRPPAADIGGTKN
jgi:uncharacterized protein (TIGR02246 family)